MISEVDTRLQRGDCFRLLAACFYEPDLDLFLGEQLCENLVAVLSACGCDSAQVSARGMMAALAATSDNEMKVEHARLFVGPFELISPPYGSVYLEERRKIMGDSTMAVQEMYRDAGLSLEEKEAPDHIAFELEFMQYLILSELKAEAQGQDDRAQHFRGMQREFLGKYLGPWMQPFCALLRQGTDNGFYRKLADTLECFMQDMIREYQETESLPKQEDAYVRRASA